MRWSKLLKTNIGALIRF